MLTPQDMLNDLDKVIRSVLDVDLFNREVEAEKQDASFVMTRKGNGNDRYPRPRR